MTDAIDLLVVGAQPYSLGQAVWKQGVHNGLNVRTAGLRGEDWEMDLANPVSIFRCLADHDIRHVVCTAGVNLSEPARFGKPGERGAPGSMSASMYTSFQVNCIGPVELLRRWVGNKLWEMEPGHFVAISSNSAHIARTQSVPYCASKAALSMSIRCLAREYARWAEEQGQRMPCVAYVYEPGFIEDTPMSNHVSRLLEEGVPAHRIPGGEGLDRTNLASMVVANILRGGTSLNGCSIRVDGGEQ